MEDERSPLARFADGPGHFRERHPAFRGGADESFDEFLVGFVSHCAPSISNYGNYVNTF